MGWSLDGLLGRKSLKASKLKTLLSLTVSRVVVLRNQRLTHCSNARSKIAQAIDVGSRDQALDHAKDVVSTQRSVDLLAEVETYCKFLIGRAPLLDGGGRVCPEELREAVASLMYVASTNSELLELQDVRSMFSLKLGSDFASAAAALRDGCGVCPKIIELSSEDQPSLESKVNVVKDVAKEKGIPFDPQVVPKEEEDVAKERQSPLHMDTSNPPEFYSKEDSPFRDVVTAAHHAFGVAAHAAHVIRSVAILASSQSTMNGSRYQSSVTNDTSDPLVKTHQSGTDPSASETEYVSLARDHSAIGEEKKLADEKRIGHDEGTTFEPRNGIHGQIEQASETELDGSNVGADNEGPRYDSSSYSEDNQLDDLREWKGNMELSTVEEGKNDSFSAGTDDSSCDVAGTGRRFQKGSPLRSVRSVRTRRCGLGGPSNKYI